MPKQIHDREANRFYYLVLFLLVFIPLYPKIPLFSPIEQYIVRVRLEDLVILGVGISWLWLLFKGKIKTPKVFAGLIGLYLVVGAASLFSAVFILGSIPQQKIHILKSLLHWARYAEYFSLFFFVSAAITTKKQLRLLVWALIGVVSVSALYGMGQRYLQFPVYSTMNREYSKGTPLVLDSPYARVQSTFAGHYDYGAFLVLVMPLILTYAWMAKTKKEKVFAWSGFILGSWGMLASASRSSFLGFLCGILIVIGLLSLQTDSLVARMKKFFRLGIVSYGLIGVMILFWGGNLSQLLITTFRGMPVFNQVTSLASQIIPDTQKIDDAVIPQYTNPVPKNQEATPEASTPPDVYVDVPEKVEVVLINEDGSQEIAYEERPRTFSQCAQEKGLSLCIRLEALWPQAWASFKTNPLIGTGYATLNKKSIFHFPEADGTDNNFLRVLGETGLMGFLTFYGLIVFAILTGYQIYLSQYSELKKSKSLDIYSLIAVAYIAGTIGLLINALYIDVFVASKVAYTFWGLTGVMGAVYMAIQKRS